MLHIKIINNNYFWMSFSNTVDELFSFEDNLVNMINSLKQELSRLNQNDSHNQISYFDELKEELQKSINTLEKSQMYLQSVINHLSNERLS